MPNAIKETQGLDLGHMKAIIDQIERLLKTLDEQGGTMPVIEKNVRGMSCYVNVLKFGISDLAELGR